MACCAAVVGTRAGHEGLAAGSFSPAPLPPTAYAGQNVLAEEEDLRLLELTRAQVWLCGTPLLIHVDLPVAMLTFIYY
jgi:hypothetical protein